MSKRRALVSTFNKRKLAVLKPLADSFEFVSTGGTLTALTELGMPCIPVEKVTGLAEMMDGRLKTLHPNILGGILADPRKPYHLESLREGLKAERIELVIGNLYDFEGDPGIEKIDIGGPTFLRAAAKNYHSVIVVVNPDDYGWVVESLLESGTVSPFDRRVLARAVFECTSRFDRLVAGWLNRPHELAVLISGSGTNLDAIIKKELPVSLVLADRQCKGLTYAEEAGIPTKVFSRANFYSGGVFDRDAFTEQVTEYLVQQDIGLIAMAGFMTEFAPYIFRHYRGKVLNTHPSLLPLFKGHYAVRDALSAGVKKTGCTVHIATEVLDEGPILAQAEVDVLEGDTEVSLHNRIKPVEWVLYPEIILRQLAAL